MVWLGVIVYNSWSYKGVGFGNPISNVGALVMLAGFISAIVVTKYG